MTTVPSFLPNLIAGEARPARAGRTFAKLRPTDGQVLCEAARSDGADIADAVAAAQAAQPAWADTPAVRRGEILHAVANALLARREEMARVVAAETGKAPKDAAAETAGAASLGRFYAGEGQRLYGRTTTSGMANRQALTVRQPVGVAGLIAAANTPVANVAWKVFPALICGNAAVLKMAEDTPATAFLFGEIARDAGLPAGVLNIVHGTGPEAGEPLVAHPGVGVISFTGSTAVGRRIQALAGPRLARVSLELGGKNPLVICDDADLDNAVKWTLLSAFSNAGQRCAAASRILIFESVYDEVRSRLLAAAARLRVGPEDGDDFGPVINGRQLERMLAAVAAARARGARVLCGGGRLDGPGPAAGVYLGPPFLENVPPADPLAREELFGPIAALFPVRDFAGALALANDSPYGLTACIHTRNFHRAMRFCERVQAGVALVNGGTYGSEPHMPFGGVKQSGNGTREPGTEALDVYSELKDIYLHLDPEGV